MALFEALGVPLCATAQSAEDAAGAASNPLAALPIDVLSPALSQLLDKRAIIGLRNSAHTVVKMLQPVGGHSLPRHCGSTATPTPSIGKR
jgi:anthranilate phosphoribosyltransferase